MLNYKETTYYTLEDCCVPFTEYYESDVFVSWGINTDTAPFTNLLKNITSEIYAAAESVISDAVLTATESNKLWKEYFYPLFCKEYCLTVEEGEEIGTYRYVDHKFAEVFIKNYIAILRLTYNKYKYLIDTLNTEKAHLLDEVKADQVERYNDSPQNGGDFSDDNHSTYYRHLHSSTDEATPMARLVEIENGLKDYYTAWANEFHSLFIHGGMENE